MERVAPKTRTNRRERRKNEGKKLNKIEKEVKAEIKTQNNNTRRRKRVRKSVSIEVKHPPRLTKGKGDYAAGTVDSCNGNIISDYTQTLLNPKDVMSRYPDGDLRMTALVRTCEIFEIPANYAAGNKTGRFSACLRPIMGTTNNVNSFHAGIVDTPLGADDWDSVDFSLASIYQNDNGGFNPRIDKNKPVLTQNQSGYFFMEAESELAAPQVSPVTGDFLFGVGIHDQDFGINNNGINVKIQPGRNDTLVIPYGTYAISVAQGYTSAVAGPTLLGVATNGSTVDIYFDESTGFAFSNQTSITGIGTEGTVFYNAVINSTPGANLFRLRTFQNTPATVLPAGLMTNITTEVSLAPAVLDQRFNVATRSGLVEEIRPIAQSCLATYMGTDFENGGMIAVHYAQPDLIESNYYSNAGDQRGQMQIYENLAAVPGAHNDRLAKGCYAWWAPYTQTDEAFRNVNDSNNYRFPGIIISGTHEVNEVPSVAAKDKVVRLEVYTIYEYTTASSVVELKQLRGSDLIIDRCKNALSAQRHTMENADHVDFLRRMAVRLLKFAKDNKEVLVKIGSLAVSLL